MLGTDQRLYMYADQNKAIGILKVGTKKLFIRNAAGAYKETRMALAFFELISERFCSPQFSAKVSPPFGRMFCAAKHGSHKLHTIANMPPCIIEFSTQGNLEWKRGG